MAESTASLFFDFETNLVKSFVSNVFFLSLFYSKWKELTGLGSGRKSLFQQRKVWIFTIIFLYFSFWFKTKRKKKKNSNQTQSKNPNKLFFSIYFFFLPKTKKKKRTKIQNKKNNFQKKESLSLFLWKNTAKGLNQRRGGLKVFDLKNWITLFK